MSLLGVDSLNYNETKAIAFATLAGASYCGKKSVQKWDCGKKCLPQVTDVRVCQGDTTISIVGTYEGTGLVVFEGTKSFSSFLTDLQFWKSGTDWEQCGGCKVHSGFLKEYESHKVCVMQSLNDLGYGAGSSIQTTGHSLGAAVNSLAMIDLSAEGWNIAESYDFGKPRTGDSDFASLFTTMFKGRTWRVTHSRDPVPHLPPSNLIVNWHFEHTEPEIFYRSKVSKGYALCTEAHGDLCAEQYKNLALDAVNLPDHLDYMGADTCPLGCKILTEDVMV